jgi:3-oxoacyl-(acyl-carrier-protein) synthase/NAD(P)-dependent dehydrogenase (short-subunit alcohol dehydrogenase family)/acyl carrier protein
VSHAFHTSIVAPASEPLKQMLQRLRLQTPVTPIISNVTGEFYPTGPEVGAQIPDMLAQQVAAPVQFVKGLRTLYDAGARVFIEVGPKKALQGFAEDVLGSDPDVFSLFTNHPKLEDATAFNQALCGLYAAGLGTASVAVSREAPATAAAVSVSEPQQEIAKVVDEKNPANHTAATHAASADSDRYNQLGRMFADVLDRGWELYHGQKSDPKNEPVVITGAAVGLPGTEHIFDDANIVRLLNGEQFIAAIPAGFRRAMLDKNITRLLKSETSEPTFEVINDVADVIKLAGRGGLFDMAGEFGISADRLAALDRVTCLAIAAGIDALRDAGIPLVMRYKTTSRGTQLPERWGLPDSMRDETGVIFGSAFPGYNSFVEIISGYFADHARRQELAMLEKWSAQSANGHSAMGQQVAQRIDELRTTIEQKPFVFDRRFLFRTLSMGHSQFAEYIGARGPNTQINSACATTTQAVSLAADWIRAGRCKRVIVIAADDVTSDNMIEWFGAGFLASGAAATDERVEEAATPFDKRRHGLIMGMGAAALVVESPGAARERGIHPICEVLGEVTANSAFHGSRLDVQHITEVMEKLISGVEKRYEISRQEIAPRTVFVSHETYTPARGGSASAEVFALRQTFGAAADQIVIANTKGYTGHAMATGIEDVLAVKALETGIVPPVPNFKEVDPELGKLNLSKGGQYPIEYALRLGAGFGSQISMTLLRWSKTPDGGRISPNALGYASRVADSKQWNTWLCSIAGLPKAELEVVQRTLRVRDQGLHARITAAPDATSAISAAPVARAASPAPVVVAVSPAPVISVARRPEPKPEPTLAKVVAQAAPIAKSETPAQEVTTIGGPEAVKARILALAVEKTGYPADMLDLDLDLEADLGVDTVKQAEIIASIREMYNIPRDESRKLRDYPTLAHVIRFVLEKRPELVRAGTTTPQQPVVERSAAAASVAAASVEKLKAAALPTPLSAGESVEERIVALFVEKTGYPKEMLDLDLDLEADLGVDTVKQAELFAAIRGIYCIPRDENLKLRDYPTLAHVIRFVQDKRPDLATSTARVTPPAEVKAALAAVVEAVPCSPALSTPATALPPDREEVKKRILALVEEKTGYPEDMLDLDLDLEADLGVDTVKQAELFAAIRGHYNIPRDENMKLRDYPTLAHVIRFVMEKRPDLVPTKISAQVTPEQVQATPVAPLEAATTPFLASSAAASAEAIKQKVLDIVAEKTGYPKDMLDLDLDLEADLGIDTVKQAEMFASVRAAYNIPRDENLKLREFPTLAHVIQFAQNRAAAVKPAAATGVTEPIPADPAPLKAAAPLPDFEATNKVPRRVPMPTLRPPLKLCKSTGVTLGPENRVLIMADTGGVAKLLEERLRQQGVEVVSIVGAPDSEVLSRMIDGLADGKPVQGVYWLPALDSEPSIEEMNLASWHESLRVRVKSLYLTMRKLYSQIATQGTFLVSATRLGGQHGYDKAGAVAPMGGAVTGFTKAYKRERPDALVKAVDFVAGQNASEIAASLLDETLRDPGAVEIGYKNGLRWTVGLREQPANDGRPGFALNTNSVFLITGAAGSIVSAVTADLAAASGGTFYLLDLIPEPDANNPDLALFVTDKDGLKRDLFARLKARGERATPALVEKELAALERVRAALTAIRAVQAAGGTAHYFSVDLADAASVAKVMEQVRQRSGRIDVLLHAAGLERSHFLPDKEPREFDLVFDVKADGWFNLLHSIGDMPVGATVAFSSVAGRFGNGGQTDYSAANDLLCKYTSSFRTTRPLTRGIVIDWTAWSGIGMATRGSIPKMMELAGIDMLPPEAAIPVIRRELTVGARSGEIVIGQRLGSLLNEWDVSGGLDTAALAKSSELLGSQGPMVGRITGLGIYSGFTMETTLDPAVQPFLNDHRIDGTPVLPGVMGIEAFAGAALCLHPGWHIETIEEVNFLAPFKFYKDEPRIVFIQAMIYPQGEKLIADCRLTGRRKLAGQSEAQETTHFTARVRLAKQIPEAATGPKPRLSAEAIVVAAQIYRIYFHGPAYRVVEKAWWDGEHMVGELMPNLPEECEPSDPPTLIKPRLIELCFQTAGLWEVASRERMGLPRQVNELSWLRPPDSEGSTFYALVTPHPDLGTFDADVVDGEGNCYLRLEGYRTTEVPSSADSAPLKALHDALLSQTVS